MVDTITLLKKFQKKKSPMRISLIYENAIKYDMYSVYIEDESGGKYLFDSFDGTSIQAFLWDEVNSIFNIKRTLSVDELAGEPFSGTYYYHGHSLDFNKMSDITNIKEIFFRLKSDISNYKLGREKYIYRKTKQELKDSISILSTIIDIHFEKEGDYAVSEHELLDRLFGRLWFYHEDKDKFRKDTKFSLSALVESKDIIATEAGYKPLGKAKNTIAEFFKTDERHHEIARIQKYMLIATSLSAVAAVASAIAACKTFLS